MIQKSLQTYLLLFFFLLLSSLVSCTNQEASKDTISCHTNMPNSYAASSKTSDSTILNILKRKAKDSVSLENMVQIPSGTFRMGGDNEQADPDEFPKHQVSVDAFWMDKTEVTNAQFKEFVEATGYQTTAERKPDWEELKKQLPPNTPKPPDSVLVPGSLVFIPTKTPVPLNNAAQWWAWIPYANWQQASGPTSNLEGLAQHPVVHISWDDAMAYAQWMGKRLPTEAEWEWAARGGLTDNIYPWGNEPIEEGAVKANYWQGQFPYHNEKKDGYFTSAPVKSFPPNAYGLYDMAGNVWEWCADWYHADYYKQLAGQKAVKNPKGASNSYDPDEPTIPKKVQRGGSFLCNDVYCSGYRVARRMKASKDTGLMHTGFRCVF